MALHSDEASSELQAYVAVITEYAIPRDFVAPHSGKVWVKKILNIDVTIDAREPP